MSESSSEYLKRTCLICGCHTNQTINIYEPRSGPNIVQLIQAKFKFQPLNEDKYLCFSCNNWLINWHSLQALNSNDAESPSGTFRSHLNSGNVVQEEKSSGSKKQVAICRPIAQIRPRQLEVAENSRQHIPQAINKLDEGLVSDETSEVIKSVYKLNFNKRSFRLKLSQRGVQKVQHKSMQQCACGKYIVVHSSKTNLLKTTTQTILKCRKCRERSLLKACYLRSIVQVEKQLSQKEPPLLIEEHNSQNLVIDTERESTEKSKTIQKQQQQPPPLSQQLQLRHNFLPKPSIDGKVVSMLRRLGTTLSREPQETGRANNTLPQIMSPTKSKPRWFRPLENDEILINFNESISEALPSLADQFTHDNTLSARKRLTFHVAEPADVINLCEENENQKVEKLIVNDTQPENLNNTFNLPQGLTISLF